MSPMNNSASVTSCCAAVYESDWVRLLIGDSLHPGGLELTERLGVLLCLGPDTTVLDVACGRGASAMNVARRFGCHVIGIDASAANIEAAGKDAERAGLRKLLDFRKGLAEQLPIDDEVIDAVICGCAFCTFADKRRAGLEFVRVLRPGGAVGLSDVTRNGALPEELRSLAAWIACVADARPAEEYVSVLERAGLTNPYVEPHDEALRALVSNVRTKLLGAELVVKLRSVESPGIDFA